MEGAGQALTAASAVDLIQSGGGEIQVIHATPEQVAQLQQTHQIQILQGEQVLVSGRDPRSGKVCGTDPPRSALGTSPASSLGLLAKFEIK